MTFLRSTLFRSLAAGFAIGSAGYFLTQPAVALALGLG